jgi:hypothetical protein
MPKEAAVIQRMIERQFAIERFCRMGTCVERTNMMRVSRQPSPIQIAIDQKQPKNVEYFNYLGSLMTNDAI